MFFDFNFENRQKIDFGSRSVATFRTGRPDTKYKGTFFTPNILSMVFWVPISTTFGSSDPLEAGLPTCPSLNKIGFSFFLFLSPEAVPTVLDKLRASPFDRHCFSSNGFSSEKKLFCFLYGTSFINCSCSLLVVWLDLNLHVLQVLQVDLLSVIEYYSCTSTSSSRTCLLQCMSSSSSSSY